MPKSNFLIEAKKKKKKKPVEVPPPPMEIKAPGFALRKNGVLFLNGEFNQETIAPLVAAIMEYNLLEDELRPEQITLVINSPGGRVNWCWQLVDAMKMSEIPVVTIAQGLAASCGLIVLMAGERRYVTHNTSLMSHQYSGGSSGKEHELFAHVKEFEMVSGRIEQHYRKCTKKSVKYVRKNLLHSTDEWLTPEEAVKHGIVDEIIETY